MFEKLVSLLSYNPSAVHQLAFYGQRLRGEAAIRRTGLIFIVLAFLVQFFAVLSPPQASVAASVNDLVNGGFNSAAEAAADCRSNVGANYGIGYGDILANYGITCDMVGNASTLTIGPGDPHWSQYFSMGRNDYAKPGETQIFIKGVPLYYRYLYGWGNVSYRALNVTKPGGQTFFLLYNCGNLTSIGAPVPIPNLSIYKTTSPGGPVAGSTVAPGQELSFRPYFDNSGGLAQGVVMKDTQPANTTYTWIGSGAANSWSFSQATHTASWTYNAVPGGTIDDYTDVKFKVNANAPNGTQICNVATVTAIGVPAITSKPVCFTVKVNAPPLPKTTPPPPPPATCPYDHSILLSNKQLCVPCQYNNSIAKSNSACKPCTASISSQDSLACVTIRKTAANLTQGVADANNTLAQPSDKIVYTLYAKNSGKATVNQFIFQDNLSDVLDYATISNLYGGSFNAVTGDVVWPALKIPAGQTVMEKVEVQVKNPIPATPVSTSDPAHFDLIMSNTYNNTINIKVPAPPIKIIEAATAPTALVDTGPSSSMFVGAAVVVFAGYFFARARLLSKETAMAIADNINGGL
jgi:uncharacterized repeat protein (TIGR01451 family)